MSKPLRIALVVAAAVIFVVLLGLSLRSSRTRDALQRYQAELRSQGEKLTYAELTSSRPTNLNFSLAVLTNTAPSLRLGPVYPGDLEPRKAVAPGKAQVLWLEPFPRQSDSRGTSAVISWEALAAEMESNRDALEEIREALRDPAPDLGLRTNVWLSPFSPFSAIRNV